MTVHEWVDAYADAWRQRDSDAAAALFHQEPERYVGAACDDQEHASSSVEGPGLVGFDQPLRTSLAAAPEAVVSGV